MISTFQSTHFHTVVVPKQSDGRPEALSNNPNRVARLGPSLISQGTRLIQNLRRAFEAAGKPFLFRSLLKHLQEPCSVSEVLFRPFHHRFAGPLSGLVARFERHEVSKRKILNGGTSGARPGNLTARDRKHAC